MSRFLLLKSQMRELLNKLNGFVGQVEDVVAETDIDLQVSNIGEIGHVAFC